jgi:hypothetical protein
MTDIAVHLPGVNKGSRVGCIGVEMKVNSQPTERKGARQLLGGEEAMMRQSKAASSSSNEERQGIRTGVGMSGQLNDGAERGRCDSCSFGDHEPWIIPLEGGSFSEQEVVEAVVGFHHLGEHGFPGAVGYADEAGVVALAVVLA